MKSFYTLQEAIEALQQPVELSMEVRERMDRSVAFLESYLDKATSPVYGVNTGFGSLQNVEISREDLSALQENLLITHAAGVGKPLSFELVRNMLWLKMLNMSKGYSAIRPEIFEKLSAMYNQGWFPVVTEQGSLGASGDLAPLSQMVLPLIGKGYLRHPQHGEISGEQWLAQNNWKPLQLGPKEALGLINGTQFMLAHAVESYRRIRQIFKQLPKVSALSVDAFDCRMDPFQSPIHRVRPHAGQISAAAEMRAILENSPIAKQPKKQVQDPYSFRCIPQVHGASYDALDHCLDVWETELNSVTDNPNVFEEEDCVLSGGNFHGQPLALTLDYAAMALSELGSISERRTYLLVSGQRGLSPYLADGAGLDSGYMIAQYSAAALASQNKQLCTPASVDSIMSSNGQEDHVSMGANAATKLLRVIENVENILAVEWLCGVAAIKQREMQTAPELQHEVDAFLAAYDINHKVVPMQELIASAKGWLFPKMG